MKDVFASPTTSPVMLPKRDFVAKLQPTSPGPLMHCPVLFLGDDPFSTDNQVLAATPLANCEWATLYAYMHHRFGPPNGNSTSEFGRRAGPCWILTTPDTNLFLLVCPTPDGAQYSFRPCLALPHDQKPPESAQQLLHEVTEEGRLKPIHEAFQASLLDLLRPVAFEEYDINALGDVDDDSDLASALQEFDGTARHYVYIVEPSQAARVPVPAGVLDNANWPAFHKIIHDLGGGDCGAGFTKAFERLQ